MRAPPEFSRLDQLSFHVAYGKYPHIAPEEVFLLQVHMPQLHGQPWNDEDSVAELVDQLTWTESGERIPFELQVRKRHSSRGADGSSADVLLYICKHLVDGGLAGVGGAAAWAALKRLRAMLPSDHSEHERFADTRQELEEYGRWSVRAAYREWLENEEEPVLIEESQADDEWTGHFRDRAGNEYEVTLHPTEGKPYRVRIGRRSQPDLSD